MREFGGSTENARAPFLAAAFWKKGVKVKGKVVSEFDTENGKSVTLMLDKPVTIDGREEKKISLGALKGLAMAVRDSGAKELQVGDGIELECTGTSETAKGNDQINFKIRIVRGDFS